MAELTIEDQGLLIPPEYLTGLSRRVRLRAIQGGIVIESGAQSDARQQLRTMVDGLREAADADKPGEAEIAQLVDEVRVERGRHP
jgi:hypothetical protein